MSFNLKAETKSGGEVDLFQLNSEDTFYCLGLKDRVPLTWKQVRDRYIEVVTERKGHREDVLRHVKKIRHMPFLVFDYE